MPTITVVIPAFNAARWIDETLDSVLAQTRKADEVIVVDDGSTDDTAERAARRGAPVTVLQQRNGGAPAAYNRGFDEASGEFVALCPADDIWHADKLARQAETLEQWPDIDVLFSRARYFGDSEGDHPHPVRDGRQDHGFLREMYSADVIPAPTAVVRRDLHQRLGRFDERLFGEDYEFWLRALRAGAVFHSDSAVLTELRQHGGNLSSQALQMWEMNLHVRTEYADLVDDHSLTARLKARDLRQIARCRFGLDDWKGAHGAYRASLRQRPTAEAALGSLLLATAPAGRTLTALNRKRPGRG